MRVVEPNGADWDADWQSIGDLVRAGMVPVGSTINDMWQVAYDRVRGYHPLPLPFDECPF